MDKCNSAACGLARPPSFNRVHFGRTSAHYDAALGKPDPARGRKLPADTTRPGYVWHVHRPGSSVHALHMNRQAELIFGHQVQADGLAFQPAGDVHPANLRRSLFQPPDACARLRLRRGKPPRDFHARTNLARRRQCQPSWLANTAPSAPKPARRRAAVFDRDLAHPIFPPPAGRSPRPKLRDHTAPVLGRRRRRSEATPPVPACRLAFNLFEPSRRGRDRAGRLQPTEAVINNLLGKLRQLVKQRPGQRRWLRRGPPQIGREVANLEVTHGERQAADRRTAAWSVTCSEQACWRLSSQWARTCTVAVMSAFSATGSPIKRRIRAGWTATMSGS